MTADHKDHAETAGAPSAGDLPSIRARLAALQDRDLPTHGGRTLAYVYDSGLADVDELGREALARFGASNGLDPTAFPSLLAMENDLVATAANLLDGAGAVGTVTSGGTESVLLAVLTARDAFPGTDRPQMVLPRTAHAAFLKAAHYFGVEAVIVDVDPVTFRADPAAIRTAVTDSTVLVVASAPSYAHGVVDPVPELAAIAAERGIRCHVDACIGGWMLPFLPAQDRASVPAWTFAVPGVTSISVDLHKYAYTPKGASLLLHRTPELRRPQYFAAANWPGYTMLNSTMQSTKSGARWPQPGPSPPRSAWTGMPRSPGRPAPARSRSPPRSEPTGGSGSSTCGWSSSLTRRCWPWRPTRPAMCSPSPTRCSPGAGSSSRRWHTERCRRPCT